MSRYANMTAAEKAEELGRRTRLKRSVIANMTVDEVIEHLRLLDAEADRPKTTQKVRLHLDIELREPHDAKALHALGEYVAEVIVDEDITPGDPVIITTAKVTQIIPAEGNFDWQGQ